MTVGQIIVTAITFWLIHSLLYGFLFWRFSGRPLSQEQRGRLIEVAITAWPVLMQHVIGCGEGKLVSLVVDYIYQSKE